MSRLIHVKDHFIMCNLLQEVVQQFLSGVSVTKIDFSSVMDELVDPEHGESYQDVLLSLTVNNPLVMQYPLKVEYQQSFMRELVKQLESRGADISSSLYERHIQILQAKNGDDVFRHFPLRNGSIVTVKESTSIICNGTTGLFVWQAAHVLINWCFKNKEMIQNSKILELGSGVGLCGIAVSKLCNPQEFICSDCHPAVMNALIQNIKINHGIESSGSDTARPLSLPIDRIMWSGKLQETNMKIAHLPWEDIIEERLASKFAPDLVIASDVVYDPSLFDALSNTLKEFVNIGSQVILACTERNSATLEMFLQKIGDLSIQVIEEPVPDVCIMPVSPDWTVKIYRLSQPKG